MCYGGDLVTYMISSRTTVARLWNRGRIAVVTTTLGIKVINLFTARSCLIIHSHLLDPSSSSLSPGPAAGELLLFCNRCFHRYPSASSVDCRVISWPVFHPTFFASAYWRSQSVIYLKVARTARSRLATRKRRNLT